MGRLHIGFCPVEGVRSNGIRLRLFLLKSTLTPINREWGEYSLVEVKKKDNESFENLLRRFNRKIQQSGVLIRARKTRYFEPRKSRNLVRAGARRRAKVREEKEEQKKLGKLVPRKFNKFRK